MLTFCKLHFSLLCKKAIVQNRLYKRRGKATEFLSDSFFFLDTVHKNCFQKGTGLLRIHNARIRKRKKKNGKKRNTHLFCAIRGAPCSEMGTVKMRGSLCRLQQLLWNPEIMHIQPNICKSILTQL